MTTLSLWLPLVEFLMLFSEEKKLRIDLTKRITEANLDKERLAQMENLLLQGKVTEALIISSVRILIVCYL